MERIRFIEHQGRRVVLLDFTGIAADPASALPLVDQAKQFVARLPPDGSALILTDVRGSRYNAEVLQGLKSLAAHNKPYAARGAVVTDSGLHRVAIMAVAAFSGRDLRGFPMREAALDWLVGNG